MNKRQLDKLYEKIRVIAEPHRIAIVNELSKGPKMVKYLKVKLNIEPTLLSHHLNLLRKTDLVTSERVGKCIKYTLTPNCPNLEEMAKV